MLGLFAVVSLVGKIAYDEYSDTRDPWLDGLGAVVLVAGAATLVVAALDHLASLRGTSAPDRISAVDPRSSGAALALVACIVLVVGTFTIIGAKDVEPTDLITGLASVDDLNRTVDERFTPAVKSLEGAVSDLNGASERLVTTTSALDDAVVDATEATTALTTRVNDVEDSADRAARASVVVEEAAAALTLSLGDLLTGQASLEERLAEIIARLDAAPADSEPEPTSSIGPCKPGQEVSIGESCSYPQLGLHFVVSQAGASFLSLADTEPQRGYVHADLIVRGEQHSLQAVEEGEGRWRIYVAGIWRPAEGLECQVGVRIEPGEYCTWRGNTLRVYATNDFVAAEVLRAQFSRGYAHLDLQYYRDAFDDRLISVSDDFVDKQGNPVSRKFIAQRDFESENRAWIIVCAD